MSFCEVCGLSISEGSKFCPSCGSEVKVRNGEELPLQVPYIDNPIVTDQTNVGEERSVYQTEHQNTNNSMAVREEAKKTITPWLGLGAFVLSIIAIFTGGSAITIFFSVIAFVIAIIALVKNGKLKGFPIAAIVISSMCVIVCIIAIGFREISKNVDSKFADDVKEKVTEKVVEEAEETIEKKADPDLVAFLDEYEAFVDEYVEFMQSYSSDPMNALNMLNEYTDMLTQLADYSSKIEKYDSESMSPADLAYYLEVTTRCAEKMLKAAENQGDK